jgi:hypothetical protein
MSSRRAAHTIAFVACLALVVGASPAAATAPSPAAAAEPSVAPGGARWITVATGLRSPRGVTIAPDGRVLVAEAGTGGDACTTQADGSSLCVGMTGAVTAVGPSGAERIVDGLPSARTSDGRIVGPAEVAVRPDGSLLVVVGSPGDLALRSALPPDPGALLGTVLAIPSGGGSPIVLADLLAWEDVHDPDGGDPNAERSADPSAAALLADGTLVVADAAANDLLAVAPDGSVTPIAVLHWFTYPVMGAPMDGGDPRAPTLPPGIPGLVPLRTAPVTVALGMDGVLIAGLRTSDPAIDGAGQVVRIDPRGRPVTRADRFTAIDDLAVAPDGSLVVLARAHRGEPGALWSVPADGGLPFAIDVGPLDDPAGLAIDGTGLILVSDRGTTTAGGMLLAGRP